MKKNINNKTNVLAPAQQLNQENLVASYIIDHQIQPMQIL